MSGPNRFWSSSFLAAAFFGVVVPSSSALPNAGLLPVTRRIHQKIKDSAGPADAAKMERYAEKVPQAGDSAIEMIPLAAGSFLLGSPAGEPGRADDEGPQRKVSVGPFWIGKTELTWGAYRAFMENDKPRNKDGTINRDADKLTSEPPELLDGESLPEIVSQPTPPYVPMHFGMGDGYAAQYPALGMTQHAASKFCEWLSAQTGHFYRLPTEAEWEYACRAGTTTAYSFGDDPAMLGDHAWLETNSDWEYQPVATRKPNPWGLHDMHGNVAEWVLDGHTADGYSALGNGAKDPWQRATGRYARVARGGHWKSGPADLRSAARLPSNPKWKAQDNQTPKSIWYLTDAVWIGFRVVRPLEVPDLETMHLYWNTGPGPGSD
jgi:formylglycine-generating enzyme required for sulfatase activity